jgi:arsenate reductase-like glutaredoxin family protein
MGLQVFGTKKCCETQKAVRWLKERGIKYQFVDLADKGISPGELGSIAKALGLEALVDKEGARYKKRGMEHLVVDLEEELLADPLLLRTPLLRDGSRAAAGYDPAAWELWVR